MKYSNGANSWLGNIWVILMMCLMVVTSLNPIDKQMAFASEDTTVLNTTVVWISDQEANTILQVLPITKDGSVQSALLVYDSVAENGIVNFISQLIPTPSQIRFAETSAFNIPQSFADKIMAETGVSVVRLEPIDAYCHNYWISHDSSPSYMIVANEDGFMPYASTYAHRTGNAFVNTYDKAVNLARNDSDIQGIRYFGSAHSMQSDLAGLASTNNMTFQQVGTLDEAMVQLTPVQLNSTESIVTVIHQNDDSSISSDYQYWKVAPIYAALRNTMLITVVGNSVEEIDISLDEKLNSNIVPNNNGNDPEYMVVCGHWQVFPYRFYDDSFPYQLSADPRYADRDNDGYYVPELAFGRITAYDISSATLLMNKGPFFDNGKMARGGAAVFSSDWSLESTGAQAIVSAMGTLYGAENLYAEGDPTSTNYSNNASRTEVLNEAKSAEIVILNGHGAPDYLSATTPVLNGNAISSSGFYLPSLWMLYACNTGPYSSIPNLVWGTINSGAINVLASVDTVGSGAFDLKRALPYLVDGEDIGTTFQKGTKATEYYWDVEVGYSTSPGKFPQFYLIGDPLVNYPPSNAPDPNRAPSIPSVPDGPVAGIPDTEYIYSSVAIDPEGHQISYEFDWGDGTTDTTGMVDSGNTVNISHTWNHDSSYSIKARATDSKGVSSAWSTALTVIIREANNPPELNPIGDKSVNEGETLTFTVAATDSDSDTLTYSASNLPDGASLDSENGEFIWVPDYNQSGVYTGVHFKVSDGVATDSEDTTITVLDVNQTPEIPAAVEGPGQGTPNAEYTYSAVTIDSDGDQVTYVFDWGDGTTDTTNPVDSGYLVNASHVWNEEGTYEIKVMATDTQGASSEWSIEKTMNVVEEGSSVSTETPWRDNENGTLYTERSWDYTMGYKFTPTVDGKITKLAGFFNGSKTVKLWDSSGNLLASAPVTSSNSWAYTPLATPVQVDAGQSYKVTAYINNSGGSYRRYVDTMPRIYGSISIDRSCYTRGNYYPTTESTIHMYGQVDIEFAPNDTGSGVNNSPELDPIGDKSVKEGETFTFTIAATDSDSDTLTYSASNLPDGASLNSENGEFVWGPDYNQSGVYTGVHFKVSDGVATDSEDITIAVLDVNQTPEIPSAAEGPGQGTPDTEYTYSAVTTDSDGDQVIYIFDWSDGTTNTTNPVDSGYMVNASHVWNEEGTYEIKVMATDTQGASSEWSIAKTMNVVEEGSSGSTETPWRDNENGTLYTDRSWDYTMGYKFTPTVDGKITKLAGFFNGSKTVKLWDSSGNLLASAPVTSSNSWAYTSLATPVQVHAGQSYKIAVYLGGTGGAYRRYIDELPITYGNITIQKSCYVRGNDYPITEPTLHMYGQVDIEFVPDGY